MASGVVDAVLIPEVNFTVRGERGLAAYLEGVIKHKGHCVVCVAEGAGQVREGECCWGRRVGAGTCRAKWRGGRGRDVDV